jgi:hypothetical protein
MGMLTGVRLHTKIGPRLYEGLGSGVLGSWTTFGGWLGNTCSALVVEGSPVVFLVSLFLPLCTCYIAFVGGYKIGNKERLWPLALRRKKPLVEEELPVEHAAEEEEREADDELEGEEEKNGDR